VTAGWLFLMVSIWGALWTLVALRPPTRPGWLMVAGFFAAWTTTEMAPIHLLVQLVATIVFVAFGALESWPGWLGLAITIGSWVGLATTIRGSLQTDHDFTEALRAALGVQWHADLDPETERNFRRVEWARVLLPFRMSRRGVRRTKNLQYVDDDSRRHRLDVYRRDDVTSGAPVLLQIHGGAWMISNKDQQGAPLMYHLADRGWVCVAINYGLSPRATWPDHLVDCKRALAWIREHIAEYGGDPDYVVVTGGSAGGHLTAMMGLTANDPAFQPGFETVDTTVQAMVPFYGVYDWTGGSRSRRDDGLRDVLERYIVKATFEDARDVFEAASPIARVHADAPPALIVHGSKDTLAPVAEGRAFAAKLASTSRHPVVYVELKGAHHAFEVFNSIRTMHAIAGVDRFLAGLVSSGRPTAEPAPPDAAPTRASSAAGPTTGLTPTGHTAHVRTRPG
jgi:acetyl esterase/lipase